jgi:hypothetical protein
VSTPGPDIFGILTIRTLAARNNAVARASPQRDIWMRHALFEKGMVCCNSLESGRVVPLCIMVALFANACYRCWSRAMEFPGAMDV